MKRFQGTFIKIQKPKPIELMENIRHISDELDEIAIKINRLEGNTQQDYDSIDKSIHQLIHQLDFIEPGNRQDVREFRKETIKKAKNYSASLESIKNNL
jgi:hypothetical protein